MKRIEQIIAEVTQKPARPVTSLSYTMGLDLGQAQDYTAVGIIETEAHKPGGFGERTYKHRLRYLHRYPLRTGYPDIVSDVATLTRTPPLTDPHTALVVDATGVGRPVVDLLVKERLDVRLVPATITSGTAVTRDEQGWYGVPKRVLVSALQIMLQDGSLQIADGLELKEPLERELAGFRVKISASGHDSYAAGDDWRSAPHDDLVLTVALAAWWASRRRTEVRIW